MLIAALSQTCAVDQCLLVVTASPVQPPKLQPPQNKCLRHLPARPLRNRCCCRTGPPSSVVLKTTYVDERVRLGKGSRGSLFVFTRGGAADAAGE